MPSFSVKIEVPKSLSAITLRQYQSYVKVLEGVDMKDGLTREASDFLNLKALEVFCGMQMKDTYKMPMDLFDSILAQLSLCFKESTPRVDRLKMTDPSGKAVEFGLMPNLSKMSLGEYLDLDAYIDDWSKMHKAMAVLYRPIVTDVKGKYLIEEYQGSDRWADVMRDAPLNVVLGVKVFFYRLGMKLSQHTMTSILQEATLEENTDLKQALEESGVGINQFMGLHKAMSEELMRLPGFHYTNA